MSSVHAHILNVQSFSGQKFDLNILLSDHSLRLKSRSSLNFIILIAMSYGILIIGGTRVPYRIGSHLRASNKVAFGRDHDVFVDQFNPELRFSNERFNKFLSTY